MQKLDEHGEDSDYEDDGQPPKIIANFGDVQTRKTVEIGVVTGYLPEMTRKEAFREIFQNWRDGIVRSYPIDLRSFAPKYSESKGLILIEPFRPSTEQLLGYIRFTYQKDGYGFLEITNFQASLEYRHLRLGATTKASDKAQTGKYGEGFKIAALVFRRSPNNHTFRVVTSGVSCNFIFKPSLDLACTITPVSGKALADSQNHVDPQNRTTTSDPKRDVSVFIGQPREVRTSLGHSTKGNKIHVDDFKSWLQVTLDIDSPDMVRTRHGDLITHSAYRNRFFLQGLELPNGGMSGKAHRYGYNFTEGDTTRDRNVLSNSRQEARQIGLIWATAIRLGGAEAQKLLTEYSEMLLGSINELGDVSLINFERWFALDIAKRVWSHMRTIKQSEDGRPAFYYMSSDGNDMSLMIRDSLKQNPAPIGAELWKLLRYFELVRTPLEELHHRFQSAEIVHTPDENFARNLEWMIQCCIQSHQKTKTMDFEFVNGGQLAIDVAFVNTKWKIHSKCLTFDGTHQDTFCDQQPPEEQDPFCCDHAVPNLWSQMLSQFMAEGQSRLPPKEVNWLKSMTRSRLPQMPRAVKCARNDKAGQLVVSWESVDSHQNKDKPVIVILHHEGCTGEPSESWRHPRNIMFSTKDEERTCECPSRKSEVAGIYTTFTGLNTNKHYFPSISRDFEGAFIGRPPSSIRPLQEDLFVKQEPDSSSHISRDRIVSSRSPGSVRIECPSESPPGAIAPNSVCDDAEEGSNPDILQEYPSVAPSTRLSTVEAHLGTAVGVEDSSLPAEHSASSVSRSPTRYLNPSASGIGIRQSPGIFSNENNASFPSSLGESYSLGASIDHCSLKWDGGFPGSHIFFRTLNLPDEDIFIAKPKNNTLNGNGKRSHPEPAGLPSAKRPQCGSPNDDQHLQYVPATSVERPASNVCNDLPRNDNPSSPLLGRTQHVRTASPLRTPAPLNNVQYRY